MNDEERDNLLIKMDTSIDDLRLKNQRVHDAIFDTNGNKGLCSRVDETCAEIEQHKKTIMRLWIAILITASATGSGIYGVVKLILGG